MREALRVLNELRERGFIRDYAVGGAIATLRWTEPFFTQDLDIFVVLETSGGQGDLIVLSPIYEYLRNKGYLWKGHWILIEGVPVDIFPADPLEEEAIEQAAAVEYEGVPTKVMTPEYLIALFLRSGREKDLQKARLLWAQAEVDRRRLEDILNRHGLHEKRAALPEDPDVGRAEDRHR